MPNPYSVPAPDDNPNDWQSQYSVPAPDDVAEKKSGGGSVLKGWLDRKIEEQKAKQKLPFGKRLLQELGNVAMPAGDFGLLSTINKVVGDGSPTKAPLGMFSPNAPTPARMAQGLVDAPIGLAQSAAHLTGIGKSTMDSAATNTEDFFNNNFDESPSGRALGGLLPFVATGGSSSAPQVASLGRGVLGILKGAATTAALTPEAHLKDDSDYADRKLFEAKMGGLIGSAPLIKDLAAKYGKPVAQKLFQKFFSVTDENKSTAARRLEALSKLNKLNDTELEMTVGQLTQNPAIKGAETASEYVPGGLSGTRIKGNAQTLKMLQNRASRSAAERDATQYRDIGDLVDAVSNGDKNAARILRDIVEPAGTNSEKIINASKEVNKFPLKQRNNALWELFKSEGDAAGPISMQGEVGRLNPFIADMERVIGPDAAGVRTARAVAEDLAAAQREIFPSNAPGSVNEFLSGSGGATSIPRSNVPGSIGEFLEANSRVQRGGIMPDTGVAPRQQSIFPQPGGNIRKSDSTVLNAGNIQESISRLKAASASVRESNPRLAGELDQIVTGMDTRLEQAASQNPSLRATLDAAKMDTKDVLRPVEEAVTALTIPGPNKEPIKIPEAIALEDKGRAAVRSIADQEALAKGQDFGGRNLEIVDNNRAATVLGDRALDQFYSGSNAEERNLLLEILRATTENAQISKNPVTGHRNMMLEVPKMMLGGGAGLLTAGVLGPGSKRLFSGKVAQELFLNNPDWKRQVANNPQLRSALEAAGLAVF